MISYPLDEAVALRKAWDTLIPAIEKNTELTDADVPGLIILCRLWNELDNLEQLTEGKSPIVKDSEGNAIKHPLFIERDNTREKFMRLAEKYRMFPDQRKGDYQKKSSEDDVSEIDGLISILDFLPDNVKNEFGLLPQSEWIKRASGCFDKSSAILQMMNSTGDQKAKLATGIILLSR